jgi:hypothetical protein
MTARITAPPTAPPAIAAVFVLEDLLEGILEGILEGEVVALVDVGAVEVVAIPVNVVSSQSLCSTLYSSVTYHLGNA